MKDRASLLVNHPAGVVNHLEDTNFQRNDSAVKESTICSLPSVTAIEWQYPDRCVAPPNWLGHIPFAFWIVGELKPRTIVELGVHSGNSYCAFLQAVRTLSLETRCFGVDHWKGDAQASFYGDEVYQELRAYHDPLYGAFSTLVRASFDEAALQFPDGSIDLLHIDGFHTYEAVSHDYATWRPKISSRGVVIFHDTNVREANFGAWRFWRELTSECPSFEFIHSHGLGIAFVGTETLPAALRVLLSSEPTRAATHIRSYFSRLGMSILDRQSARQQGEQFERQVDEAKKRATALEIELQSARSDISHLSQVDAELRAAQAKVAKLEIELQSARSDISRLTQVDAELRAAQAKVADTCVQNQTLTLITRHQTAAMSRLQSELISLNNDRQHLNSECNMLRSECNMLRSEYTKAHEGWHHLQSECEKLREAYQTMLRSTSWRVTGPIRFILSKLKRGIRPSRAG